MPTSIHGFGPNGELSPGAALALADAGGFSDAAGPYGGSVVSAVAATAIGSTIVPAPLRPNSTVTASTIKVAEMSADGLTLYGFDAVGIHTSTDDGATWNAHITLTDVAGIRETESGELLVSVRPIGAAGEVWVTSGGQSAVTKSLTAASSGAYFQAQWALDASPGLFLAAEYGDDGARYLYRSTDDGATWDTIFDLGGAPNSHLHGVAYDPWWDRIWLVAGDANYRTVVYSDDKGDTWTALSSGSGTDQLVGILPMPDAILFTTDSQPNGVRRVLRVNKALPIMDTALVVDASQQLTILGGRPYYRNGIAYLPFARIETGRSSLYATADGVTFHCIWESAVDMPLSDGLLTIVGPTAAGNLVGYVNDDGTPHILQLSAPKWVGKPTRTLAPVLELYSVSEPNKGHAYTTSTIASPTDLDVRVDVQRDTWMPATEETLAGAYLGADGSREWYFSLRADGRLNVRFYPLKTNASVRSKASTVAPTTATPGARCQFRVTVDVDNGSGGYTCTFYEKVAGEWTVIGSPVVTAGATTLPTISQPVTAGGYAAGQATGFNGRLYSMELMAGIDSPSFAARIDFSDPQWAIGDRRPTSTANPRPVGVDAAGVTWDLYQDAVIKGTLTYPTLGGLVTD